MLTTTREGIELAIEWSNQVWQCDHTKIDVLVVDQSGEVLGRPWLTIAVDTYSRCIMVSRPTITDIDPALFVFRV